MQIIADLHIHSAYSRACSKDISLETLEKYARIKGLNLLGTGDFLHPKWQNTLLKNLTEDRHGILRAKTGFQFLWQTEISLMYSQDGKSRKVHHIILAPDKDTVLQLTEAFQKLGRTDYDGRPIFGISSIELVDLTRSINKKILIIPAHAWTPWFGILGSKSGFDSIQECFKEKTKYIYAIETGLSSDPAMNHRLSSLDNFRLVSFSDAHSYWPWRLGREATIFNFDKLTYDNIHESIKTGKNLQETIEVEPAYGKYHADGHRNCNFCSTPQETKKINGICPKCKKPLTIGVWNRVETLADRKQGYRPENAKPFRKLMPLSEILSKMLNKGISTKNVQAEYQNLVTTTRSELDILINTPLEELKQLTTEKIANAIILNRKGKVNINPGYDGKYGEPIFQKQTPEQKSLGEF